MEQLHVDVTLDDVMCEDVLKLNDKVMAHLVWHHSQELNDQVMLRQSLFPAFLRCRLRTHYAIKCGQDSCSSLLTSVSRNLLIHGQNNETTDAHEKFEFLTFTLLVLVVDDLNHQLNRLPE